MESLSATLKVFAFLFLTFVGLVMIVAAIDVFTPSWKALRDDYRRTGRQSKILLWIIIVMMLIGWAWVGIRS
jgi:predicted tellurium resistance membrane protein TerC